MFSFHGVGKEKIISACSKQKKNNKTSTSTGTYAKICSKNNVSLQAALQQVHLKAYYAKTMFQKRLTTAKNLKKILLKRHHVKFQTKKENLSKVNNFK